MSSSELEQCLFCGTNKDLTEEHVIPGGMGCDVVVPSASCGTHNGKCSSDFEAKFLNALKPLLHLLSIGNRRGIVPSTDVDFVVADQKCEGYIKGDGSLIQYTRIEKRVDESGKPYTRYSFSTKKDLDRFLKKAATRGKKVIVEPPGDPVLIQPHSSIELGFVDRDEAKRTVAKIALMVVAFKAGTRVASGEAFREVRDYVLIGNERGRVRLFHSEALSKATVSATAFHHVVFVWADGKSGEVWAIVILFGGLSYLVKLSGKYTGPDFGATYAHDALNRKEALFLQASLENERLAVELVKDGKTVFDDVAAVCEPWTLLVEKGARRVARTLVHSR